MQNVVIMITRIIWFFPESERTWGWWRETQSLLPNKLVLGFSKGSLDQQHLHHLKTCQKHTILGFTTDPPNQKLWGGAQQSVFLEALQAMLLKFRPPPQRKPLGTAIL